MFGIPSFGIIINIWHSIGTEQHAHIAALHSFNATTGMSLPPWTLVLEIPAQGSEPFSCLLFTAVRADLCGNLLKPNSLPLYRNNNLTESPLQHHLYCAVTQPQLDFHYKGIIAFNPESRRWHVGVGDVPSNLDLKESVCSIGHAPPLCIMSIYYYYRFLLYLISSVFYSRNKSQIIKQELILIALCKK